MPIVNLVGAGRQDPENIAASTGRLVNYYREGVGQRFVLKNVPGTTEFADLPGSGSGQAMEVVGNLLFVIASNQLFSVFSDGTYSNRGTLAASQYPTIAGYDSDVMIESAGDYYVWDGSTLSTVTGGAFSDVGSVCFVSGYGVLTRSDSDQFEWTDLRDPGTRAALNTARAEAADDFLLRGMELNGNLYLFGTRSIEVWGLTGQAGANAFSRLPGGVINRGLLRKSLVCKAGQVLAFVGEDYMPYVLIGDTPQAIGNPRIVHKLKENDATHVFYYEHEGHKFITIRFSDATAEQYNIAMKEWNERASGANLEPWDVVAAAPKFGEWLVVGDGGVVSTLGGTNDNGSTLLRKAVGETLEIEGRRFNTSLIEVRGRGGYRDDTEIMLRLSRDRGNTWTDPKVRSLGDTGEYGTRAVWRSQGRARTLTIEVSQSDDGDVPIFSDVRVDVS